jgi:acetate---CoA ligase (ADP-forming)
LLKTPQVGKASLASVFKPASVAVVGASPTSQWGKQALENFTTFGFSGDVVAVNPKYDEIIGYRCYPSLRAIPFAPEAVLIGVNRERVLPLIEEAAEVGAKAAVIFAIGFAEAGREWGQVQERITQAAIAAGMAVIGPNCQGSINFVEPCAMYMSNVEPYEPGCVAMFAQSGSVTTALLNNKRGVRWSHAVSCGNEAVSGAAELLGYFVDEPHTKVICGFIETIRKPGLFFRECERARQADKAVVILKSGRTEAARKAATAHSGALASPDRLYDEMFKRHGVLRVDTQEELLETAIALQSSRRPAGGRVAAVTASGGQIELILDETGKYPETLSHPELASETKTFLRRILPDFLATSNPLDYWGVADYVGEYPKILGALADDPNIDIVVGIADPNHGPTGTAGAESRSYEATAELAARSNKLITLVTPLDGEPSLNDVEDLLDKDVLLLSGFPEGFRALERLVTWCQPRRSTASAPQIDEESIKRTLDGLRGRPLAGQPALDLLSKVGIPVVKSIVATSADEAVAAAAQIGYPIVAKIGDPDVLHKTEAGGVHLGLGDPSTVRDAVKKIQEGGSRNVLIQEQVRGGVEMILGLQTDPLLGTFVLTGLGGIWTEVINDVSLRPVALLEDEAHEMVRRLRSAALLTGARGAARLDTNALADAITRIDAIGRTVGSQLESIDVNPLVVLTNRVVALDALIVPRKSA